MITDYEVAVLDALAKSGSCDVEELRPWAERAFEINAEHLSMAFFPPFPYLQGPRVAARALLRREAERLEHERTREGVRGAAPGDQELPG